MKVASPGSTGHKARAPRVKNRPLHHPNYPRWRALSLSMVYLLIAFHILHWKIAGKTLAPLELNEVMYTFELGIVTAGFLFMAAAILATAIFGRFFCSWGCHILALQDLCAWALGKMRIHPKAIRSRVLLWVPVVVAAYMFVWPQAIRLWEGRPPPSLRIASDAEGWASFTTENFWRNLPSPSITILTFAICGFLIVYVLGSRSFCAYGCPYGAVFGLTDRIAPGRIRVKSGGGCDNCGVCTAVCGSHVRVHEEIARYGMIVNPACLKDLDCVSVCPDQSLHYGFGRPSLAKQVLNPTPVRKQYDFRLWEEGFMVLAFVTVLLVFRGLYDRVPFLLTIGLGAIAAYSYVVLMRLLHQPTVVLNRLHLKESGRLSQRGWGFVVVMAVFSVFTVHSAMIRYHAFQGSRYDRLARLPATDSTAAMKTALTHLTFVDRWGLFSSDRNDAMLGSLYAFRERWPEAEIHLQRSVKRSPQNLHAQLDLGRVFVRQGKLQQARHAYESALRLDPQKAETHYAMAGLFFEEAKFDDARAHLLEAIRLRPDFAQAELDLGAILIETGDVESGVEHLRRCVLLNPNLAEAHHNLGVALAMLGLYDEAEQAIERALVLTPEDDQTRAFQQHLQSVRDAAHDELHTMPTGDRR